MLSRFRLPIIPSLRSYSVSKARRDGTAGLTLALLAVPQCMAYALIAGLNPVYGIYAAFTGVIVGSLLSSSEFVITGPTAKVSLVVGSVLLGVEGPSLAGTVVLLSLMVGVFQILFALFRAGSLARYVSESVLRGFILGGALVIIGDQCIYLLGADVSKSPYFIQRFIAASRVLVSRVEIPIWTLALGGGTVLVMLGLRWLSERLPAGILTILIGTVVSVYLNLDVHGVDLVGTIPGGLPDFTLPPIDPGLMQSLLSGAFSLTILGSVQSISIGKSIASDTRSEFDENQELLSQGTANIITGLFQGYPVSASFSRSFFNHNTGARTRGSGLFCGLFIATILFLAAPLVVYIPIPVLAGLIIVVVGDVFDGEQIRETLRATRWDQIAFAVTFVGVLVLKLDTAIYAGVIASLLLYLRQAKELDLKEYIINDDGELEHIKLTTDRTDPRIALIDVNGEAFFGAAEEIRSRIRSLCEHERLQVIILRMKNAMNLDANGALVLKELGNYLRDRDMTLMISGATPRIRDVLNEADVTEVIQEDKILVAQESLLVSTRQAITRAKAHIDSVLEGEESRRGETDRPLKHTMEQLKEDQETPGEKSEQNPLTDERIPPDD